jgi:hypothetical protein
VPDYAAIESDFASAESWSATDIGVPYDQVVTDAMPPRRGARVADRVVAELAIVHGFARRLLVFELPDQLMLGFVKGASDVAVVGDGHERRETRQGLRNVSAAPCGRGPARRLPG